MSQSRNPLVPAQAIAFFMLLALAAAPVPTEPVTIAILALDDRPPNTLLVKQVAAVAGIDLVFTTDPTEADLVSINAAVAGSLVGSRTADPLMLVPPVVSPEALLHFAVPRIEPTVVESDARAEYARIRTELENPDLQREILAAIRGDSDLPADEYLAAYVERMLGWLDLLDRGGYAPARLLITLDDNRPGPLSDGLKLLLGEYSHHVQDGTDEGMLLLLARALREMQISPPPTCGLILTAPGDLAALQPFESGTVAENALEMARWLGLKVSPRLDLLESWRPALWIHGAGSAENERADFIRERTLQLGDRPVIVADIALANGADPALMEAWRSGATPPGLVGYLAWNTSSNTLGSAFALWAAIDFAYEHGADPQGVRAAAETFLCARLLDDYLYQRIVRAERSNVLRSEGGDPYHLTDEQVMRETEQIAARLTELWAELGESLALPLRIADPMGDTGFIVELPWSRFFEIALYPTDDRGILPVIRPTKPDTD